MALNVQALLGKDSDFDKVTGSREAGSFLTIGSKNEVKQTKAVQVDLASSLINNNAYGKNDHKMGDDITKALNTDAQTRHNFLNVMANTLSSKDFAKGMEEGFDMSEAGGEASVTILDKIKATLAESGQVIIGFTDDISVEKLEKITGSRGLANEIVSAFHENDIPVTKSNVEEVVNAVSQMKEVTGLSDGALKYMTLNDIEPTMDNIYMATHATNGQNRNSRGFYEVEAAGYFAQKPESLDWESIKDQAGKIVEDAGFSKDDKVIMDKAKWMVEESIPLTKENLVTVAALGELKLPMSEKDVVINAASSIANKRPAASGKVEGTESNLGKAIDIYTKTRAITDEDVAKVVAKNEDITLKNLFDASEKSIESAEPEKASAGEGALVNNPALSQDEAFLAARKSLEEVRLSMTVEANLRLIDKGFAIDTAPITKVIEELDVAIKEIGTELFGKASDLVGEAEPAAWAVLSENAAKYRLFEETTSKVSELRLFPAAVSGRLTGTDGDTLENIYNEAKTFKARFDKAELSYEALGTAPRKDMGDSIRKAFRNVDDILKDLGEELNEENRRVVRILGYNKMEISKEKIEAVRTVDEKLTRTVDRLKPGAVLQMIRDGHNPLKMTLDQLSQELSDQDKDGSKRDEKYSRFLYKLEKNNEITPEEKESYIGIYRLFHRLKVTDNAAIGTLLETGAEMTIENLLTATRTMKKKEAGMDYKVDDDFGGAEGRLEARNISAQIETAFLYYSEKADVVYANLEPEKLHKASPKDDTLLDELADKLEEISEEKSEETLKTEQTYFAEKAREARAVTSRSDAASLQAELSEYGIEEAVENLQAMLNIRAARKGRNSVWDQAERVAHLAFKEIEQEMLEELQDAEDYKDSYEGHLIELAEQLDEILLETAESYIDVRAIHLVQKQISVMNKMADRGTFEVPVDIDGRTVSMKVTLKDSESGGSKVEAAVETLDFGHISMAMTGDESGIKGVFATSLTSFDELTEFMEGAREKFINELTDKGINVDIHNVGIMYHTTNAGDAVSEGGNGFSDSRDLLRMAGIFIQALQ